jgi:PhzF family phenazine biosynthesis protein
VTIVRLAFRILNVFAIEGDRLSGNPLCVFEDGRGLSAETMQALARQFNLSETTFVLPADSATAAVRIFTPVMELPFAGHPTLGTAHVVRDLLATGPAVTLAMDAGIVPVSADGGTWTLVAGQPQSRAFDPAQVVALSTALGLAHADLSAAPMWVSTGIEQLLVPLTSPDAVDKVRAGQDLSAFTNDFGKVGVYVFSPLAAAEVKVRFFFGKAGGVLMEDPATGSACANLGGYALAMGITTPLKRLLMQGEQIARPSRLRLEVDQSGRILVGGVVIEVGRGQVEI